MKKSNFYADSTVACTMYILQTIELMQSIDETLEANGDFPIELKNS